MDYKEALRLAKEGRDEGFRFLYEETYKSKYYLALQYMKNEEAAKDVLQEAYIRAFAKLDTLEKPEAFPGWFGTIVANTAKNMLQKKNPMLFTDIAVDEEETFTYDIEDENMERQPELSYTRKETEELVHEMINALSEEQRVCILMFEIEGIPIKEIAATLNCSENTVKSRLNYGRKNLKAKAEELQKKGYKLYGIAPLPLLLYLLRMEEGYLSMEGTFLLAKEQMAEKVFRVAESKAAASGTANAGADAAKTGADAVKTGADAAKTGADAAKAGADAAKTGADAAKAGADAAKAGADVAKAGAASLKNGFLHTVVGKVVAAAIAVCVVGGTVYYGVSHNGSDTKEPEVQMTQDVNISDPGAGQQSPKPEEQQILTSEETQNESEDMEETKETKETEETAPAVKELKEEDYPSLIAGGLSREEVEFVLAYGPQEFPVQGAQADDYLYILNALCMAVDENGLIMKDCGRTANYQSLYYVENINRLFASFTSFQFTEENDNDSLGGINVDGDLISVSLASLNYKSEAVITSAEYTEDEMSLYFTYDYYNYDTKKQQTQVKKRAVLHPAGDGTYRIADVEDVQEEAGIPEQTGGSSKQEVTADTPSMDELYADVLESIRNQEPGYGFPNGGELTGQIQYFFYDMDGDGIQELVVGAGCQADVFEGLNIRVYSCQKSVEGYSIKAIEGDTTTLAVFLPQNGNGLLAKDFARGTGKISYYRITVEDGVRMHTTPAEREFTMGDEGVQSFEAENAAPQWIDISSPQS